MAHRLMRRHVLKMTLMGLAAWASAPAQGADTDALASARYEMPVARYGHYAPGPPHEYARITATTVNGRSLTLQLPDGEVFEDVAPRRVMLGAGYAPELLAIVSRRPDGARAVLIGLKGGRLEISAETPAIGTAMRWLNPVGVADLDGDGQAEVALVTTPHLGGVLRVYRREGARLVEVASQPGFSNHVYGSAELGLSRPVTMDGRTYLLVPDNARLQLRLMALRAGQLVEAGRCPLPAPVVAAVAQTGPGEVLAGLQGRSYRVELTACLNPRAAPGPGGVR